MKYIENEDTLVIQMAREFQRRDAWFGDPLTQAVIFLYQELLDPTPGFEFHWGGTTPRSPRLTETLEYARGRRWLRWETRLGHYGPTYLPTPKGLKVCETSLWSIRGERILALLDSILPNFAQPMATVQFFRAKYDDEVGLKRLQALCPEVAQEWGSCVGLLDHLRATECRPGALA